MKRLIMISLLLVALVSGAVAQPGIMGGLGNAPGWYGPTWSYNSATALLTNTPGKAPNLLTDPGLENWASPTNLTNWNESVGGDGRVDQEATIINPGGSVYSAKLTRGTTGVGYIKQDTSVAGQWYYRSGYIRSDSGTPRFSFGFGGLLITANTTFTQYETICWPGQLGEAGGVFPSDNGSIIYADDLNTQLITLKDLFFVKNFGVRTTSLTQVAITNATLPVPGAAGAVACLDNPTDPKNYYVALLAHNSKVYAFKVINGAYTSIITAGTVTYGSTKKVSISIDATTVKIYYDTGDLSAQVGATYTKVAGDPDAGTYYGFLHPGGNTQINFANSVFTGS